jgi:hypothetical protein
MVYITGDTHGDFHRFTTDNFPQGTLLTKEDVVIIAGDFGGLWANTKEERYWLDWLAEKPWTTCFVDGNHENFDMVDRLEVEEKFGGPVGVVKTERGEIYHLRRGNIYTFGDDTVFVFGGGLSIDKQYRTEDISWWAREYPNEQELDLAWSNIRSSKAINYVITHVPPLRAMPRMSPFESSSAKTGDLVAQHLNDMFLEIRNNSGFKKWYHGHMHYDDQFLDNVVGLYWDVLKLGQNTPGFEKRFGQLEQFRTKICDCGPGYEDCADGCKCTQDNQDDNDV